MSIETNCPGCGRLLRVADEHAGRQARCPVCNTIYLVPASSDAAGAAASPSAAEDGWYMKTPEQQMYGPVSQDQLQRWLDEGRISASCQLRSEADPQWHPADEYFGVLRSGWKSQPASPFASPPPSAPPAGGPDRAGVRPRAGAQVPHRGALVLVLGLLGWITCPIFGVLAWSMGSSDLREMQCGRMDPSGQGLTQAGQVLGMINVLLWIGILVLGFLGALVAVVA